MKMNGAQLHLLFNHFPVLIPLLGLAVLLVGLWLKRRETRDVGTAILLASAGLALPAYFTGEPAENIVQNYPDVSHLLIHDHQSFALISLLILEVAGVIAAILLFGSARKKSFANKSSLWALLIAVVLASCATMGWTAHLGGLIRHEEIRTNDRF